MQRDVRVAGRGVTLMSLGVGVTLMSLGVGVTLMSLGVGVTPMSLGVAIAVGDAFNAYESSGRQSSARATVISEVERSALIRAPRRSLLLLATRRSAAHLRSTRFARTLRWQAGVSATPGALLQGTLGQVGDSYSSGAARSLAIRFFTSTEPSARLRDRASTIVATWSRFRLVGFCEFGSVLALELLRFECCSLRGTAGDCTAHPPRRHRVVADPVVVLTNPRADSEHETAQK